jgi:hypothetical protein
MSMKIFYLIFNIIICLFNISCTSLTKTKDSFPCGFDTTNLIVVGKDTDFNDSISILNISPSRAVMHLMDVDFSDNYRVNPDDFNKANRFSYKIFECRDTLWAKKVLLDEIGKRYPYKIIDTIERYRIYDITFKDTSDIMPTEYSDPYHLGFYIYPDNVIKVMNREYTSVVSGSLFEAPENKNVRVSLGKITPPHLEYKRYDILFPNKYYNEPIPIDKYIKFLSDSLSIEVKLAKEYTIPIKMIKLK